MRVRLCTKLNNEKSSKSWEKNVTAQKVYFQQIDTFRNMGWIDGIFELINNSFGVEIVSQPKIHIVTEDEVICVDFYGHRN